MNTKVDARTAGRGCDGDAGTAISVLEKSGLNLQSHEQRNRRGAKNESSSRVRNYNARFESTLKFINL